MGMDVWVVKMEHIDSPKGLVKDFLFELAINVDWDDDMWGGGWNGNVFFEAFRDDFERKVRDYASEKGLSQEDKATLVSWVEALPWERDDIMLTLNW